MADTKPANKKSTPTVVKPPAQPSKASASADDNTVLKGIGTGITMRFTDPKTGQILWTAKVKSIEAVSQSEANSVYGTLHNVDGKLYSKGQAADHLTAHTVNVDNTRQIVVATGGVVVTSLTQADTRLTCDQATYYAAQGKLVGKGHVVFTKAGFTQAGPSFAADTKLKFVTMPAPGDAAVHDKPIDVQLTM